MTTTIEYNYVTEPSISLDLGQVAALYASPDNPDLLEVWFANGGGHATFVLDRTVVKELVNKFVGQEIMVTRSGKI